MTELDELRRLAAGADQEASAARALLGAQTSLMQSLRETQNSMSRVLGEQGTALGALLLEISKIQTRITSIERDHGTKLDQIQLRITSIERDHGTKLDEHGTKLDEILNLLRLRDERP